MTALDEAASGSRTDTKVAWGYGLGSMMRIGENLFGFYLIYYLTTVAGISPGIAGTIGGSALLIGALTSPLIGYFSDRSRSKYGRRRPFMLVTAVPSMVLLTMLFTVVDFGEATGVYYFVVALVFAVVYYAFLVPYDALGSSLTLDYNQRTTIRSICTAILYFSVLVGGTLVVQVQALLVESMPVDVAWTVAVVLTCTLPGALLGLVAWRVTRGREPAQEPAAPEAQSIKTALTVFKLRPVWAILSWAVFFFFANGLMGGSLIYYGVYAAGLTESVASTFFMVSTLVTLVFVLPGNALAKRVGKRNAIFVAMAFFLIVSATVLLTGIDGYLAGAIMSGAFGICNSVALSCCYAMIYDLRELTQLKLGDDRSAVILGWLSLVIGVSSSSSYIFIGALLEAVAFDPTAAPTPAVIALLTGFLTWVPALFLLVGSAALAFWNVNAFRHAQITEEIQIRTDALAQATTTSRSQ